LLSLTERRWRHKHGQSKTTTSKEQNTSNHHTPLPETEQTELAGEGKETVLLTEKIKTETQNGRRERKNRSGS
jgi:hypothetical protein